MRESAGTSANHGNDEADSPSDEEDADAPVDNDDVKKRKQQQIDAVARAEGELAHMNNDSLWYYSHGLMGRPPAR